MVLGLRGIAKRFGATVALAGVDLDVNAGEVLALVGENGSGKSTLMKVAAGVILPDAGTMELSGHPFRPRNPAQARQAGIAMIHQELALCNHLTVAENIMLGIESRDGAVRVREALARLGHGDISPRVLVGDLPIGARQIVEIARAVAAEAQVVILDEPTSSLSESDVERLFGVVEALRSQGKAIVYISHFLEEVQRLSNRIAILRDGQKVAEATHFDQEEMVRLMVGRPVEDLYPRHRAQPGETVLAIEGLAGRHKPEEATLELRRGEIVGLAGLNGSGRTELLRTVFGLDAVSRGQIRVGAFTGSASPSRRWRQGMGMLSEDRKDEGLALGMSLADNATLPSLRHPLVSPGGQRTNTQRWIDSLGVRCQGPAQAVGALSGGNQQKIAFARLLEAEVDVLLLDEPTRGIDVGSKQRIYQEIARCAEEGKAVLVASSYLPELLGICDRIAVMRRGVLGPARPVAEATQESLMKEALGS